MTYESPAFDSRQALKASLQLLIKRPVLALPMVVNAIVLTAAAAAAVFLFFVVAFHDRSIDQLTAQRVLGIALATFASVALYAFCSLLTICATPFALADRPIAWGRVFSTAGGRLWQFTLLEVVTVVATIIVLPFCIVLIGIPALLALWYFLTYAEAAVALDGQSAIQAMVTSARIARARVPETAGAWLGLLVAMAVFGAAYQACTHLPVAIVRHIPMLNITVICIVGAFAAAYCAIVRVRFYLALRPAPAASAIGFGERAQ